MSKQKSKQKKLKSIKTKRKILIGFEVVFAILVLAAASILFIPTVKAMAIQAVASSSMGKYWIKYFGQQSYDSSVYDYNFDENKIKTNDMEYNYSTEYTNFIIFGIDTRTTQFDSGTNSDSMLVVSIHNTTGEVKIVSIYRDTYMRVYYSDGESYYYTKINAAYSVGGAEGAINTLNRNLDLQLTDYVTVNFSGVAKIIDCLGGIEVNLTENELAQLNYHLEGTAIATGEYTAQVPSAGKNIHLNGVQATTYCRIRKATFYDPETGDAVRDDFGRAARQRSVIMKLVEKAKGASVAELTEMLNTVLSANSKQEQIIKTSFTMDEMIDMIPIIFKFELAGSEGFPRKLTTGYIGSTSYVFPKGHARNVSILHDFLYGEEDYNTTAIVNEIGSEITATTGITEDLSDDDVDDTISHISNPDISDMVDETITEEDYDFDYDDGGQSEFY